MLHMYLLHCLGQVSYLLYVLGLELNLEVIRPFPLCLVILEGYRAHKVIGIVFGKRLLKILRRNETYSLVVIMTGVLLMKGISWL